MHALHRQVLDGVEGAEIHLNRYLMVCSILSPPSSPVTEEMPNRDGGFSAHLVLDCMCGDPAHAIHLRKHGYRQQFKLWRRSSFVEMTEGVPAPNSANRPSQRTHARVGARNTHCRPLHIPIMSLVGHVSTTHQYNLLPDLGHFMRMMIQRRYFSEQSKKHWVRAASQHQVLGGYIPSCHRQQPQNHPNANHVEDESEHCNGSSSIRGEHCANNSAQMDASHAAGWHSLQGVAAKSPSEAASRLASWGWQQGHGLCATLLHDSIPCIKRSKRSCLSTSASCHSDPVQPGSKAPLYTPVDVCACVNVLYGTLLKLYNLGAKVPTFNSRVNMMSRLMHISSLSMEEQASFLRRYPFLTRLCFMEYTLNALVDWMPCEKELIFGMCTSMQTYASVAVAMCDVFRQDAIITGHEDWSLLNKAASVSIERCIRVCKFKMVKLVEPPIKYGHLQSSLFDQECLKIPFINFDALSSVPMGKGSKNAGGQQLQNNKAHGGKISNRSENALCNNGGMSGDEGPFEGAELGLFEALLQSISQSHSSATDQGSKNLRAAMESCRAMHSNLRIYALPECVALAQKETLDSIHSACTSRLASAQRISFCVVCAANGKGFKGKLRMCCISGDLSCVACNAGDYFGTILDVSLTNAYKTNVAQVRL